MSVVTIPVPAHHRLDHESNNENKKTGNPVDAIFSVGGLGLRRRFGIAVPQSPANEGEDTGTSKDLTKHRP